MRTAITDAPPPARAEVVIVGGGIMGLSIAYNLASRGLTDVVVFERGYLAEGASGRNGGGVRQQWSTEINVRLMQESVELCRRFALELGVNVWFRQGGYLFLARSRPDDELLHPRVGRDIGMTEPIDALLGIADAEELAGRGWRGERVGRVGPIARQEQEDGSL